MGFGVLTVGFLALLLSDFGGGLIAGAISAYGLYLASRLEKKFATAAICALLMMPFGVLQLLDLVAGIEIPNTLLVAGGTLFYLAWGGMMLFFLLGVKRITIDNGAHGFERETDVFLYFNMAFFALEIGTTIFPLGQMTIYLIVAKYIVVVANLLFAHKCFTLISTAKKTASDIKELAELEKREAEKKKKREEENSRIAERNKKP